MFKVKALMFKDGELGWFVILKKFETKSAALEFARDYARTQAKIIGINEVNNTEDGAEYSFYEHVFEGGTEIRFFIHYIYKVIESK